MLDPLFVIPTLTGGTAMALWTAHRLKQRWELSRAKAPNLTGHVRWAKRLARWVPGYAYDAVRWYRVDGAPAAIAQQRRDGLLRLAAALRAASPDTLATTDAAEPMIADLQFTRRYRVPFQFRDELLRHIPITAFWQKAEGNWVFDLDGKAYLDLTGSYGLNLLGTDFYKRCVDEGVALSRELGPVLGSYHPCVLDNVQRLCKLSGMDQVSFHMSGTEAVMQAVRLARYHTGRDKVVRFSGAYHGWWDDVQPGPGNPAQPAPTTLTLREGHANTLHVLATRNDIACVLINPLQSMHLNASAPSDSTLVLGGRKAVYDRAAYTQWLQALRRVCSERNIALIFDEVFMGFRLSLGGAQAYFGVQADMVTYGKTLGGGLPVGVICGKSAWMKRYRDDRPADICFARGTFNAHPYVMGAMNVFLRQLDTPEVQAIYDNASTVWHARMSQVNEALRSAGYPLRFVGMETVWTLLYDVPSRYNWMLQFYVREQGIALSWVGTGRWVFNLSFTDEDFAEFVSRLLRACAHMQADGWWWVPENVQAQRVQRGLFVELLRHKLRIA
jgi:glutamate-1-semialdehyde 2,1-aminomutase